VRDAVFRCRGARRLDLATYERDYPYPVDELQGIQMLEAERAGACEYEIH
jgi:hypothetical protein